MKVRRRNDLVWAIVCTIAVLFWCLIAAANLWGKSPLPVLAVLDGVVIGMFLLTAGQAWRRFFKAK